MQVSEHWGSSFLPLQLLSLSWFSGLSQRRWAETRETEGGRPVAKKQRLQSGGPDTKFLTSQFLLLFTANHFHQMKFIGNYMRERVWRQGGRNKRRRRKGGEKRWSKEEGKGVGAGKRRSLGKNPRLANQWCINTSCRGNPHGHDRIVL